MTGDLVREENADSGATFGIKRFALTDASSIVNRRFIEYGTISNTQHVAEWLYLDSKSEA